MPAALFAPGAAEAVQVLAAATFVVSGVLKARSWRATLDAMAGLGVPARLRTAPVARAVAPVEVLLGLAALTLAGPPVLTALGALVLVTIVFTVLVVVAVARGRAVRCNCFGTAATAPLSWWSAVRNAVVLLALGVAIADPAVTHGLPARLATLDASGRTWFAAAVLGTVVVVVVLRRQDAAAARSAVLDAPADADVPEPFAVPDVLVADLIGARRPLAELAALRAQLLVVLRPGCAGCRAVAELMPAWQEELGAAVQVRAVTTASFEDFAAAYRDLCEDAVYVVESDLTALRVRYVPSAVLLGTNGVVAAGPLVGADAVADLVAGISAMSRS